jgi:hypothetical protein
VRLFLGALCFFTWESKIFITHSDGMSKESVHTNDQDVPSPVETPATPINPSSPKLSPTKKASTKLPVIVYDIMCHHTGCTQDIIHKTYDTQEEAKTTLRIMLEVYKGSEVELSDDGMVLSYWIFGREGGILNRLSVVEREVKVTG